MKPNRIYEQNTGHAKSIKLKTLNEIAESICKVKVSNQYCSGFYLKIQNDQKILYMIMTSYQIIPLKLDKMNNEIEIIHKNENLNRKIVLNNNERKIVCLEDKDVTAIEILEKDNLINNVKFLNYDLNCKFNVYVNYLDIDTFIIHYPKEKYIECNSGKITLVKSPKEFQFHHTLVTDEGSSGSPILLFEKPNEIPKVVGVNTSLIFGKKFNIGTFIDVLIDSIVEQKNTDFQNCEKNNNSINSINSINVIKEI